MTSIVSIAEIVPDLQFGGFMGYTTGVGIGRVEARVNKSTQREADWRRGSLAKGFPAEIAGSQPSSRLG
ncbi:MAG: hypothetical protein K6U12_04810 [Armatimonadetes bacterium]|nr:hypothetical protein [Armatimonadota bacterium]